MSERATLKSFWILHFLSRIFYHKILSIISGNDLNLIMEGFNFILRIKFVAHRNKSFIQHFRYSGSLTAPPCTENVTWIIFKQPIGIILKQLEEFRKLLEPSKKVSGGGLNKLPRITTDRIENNYRKIQREKDSINKKNRNYVIYENSASEPANPLPLSPSERVVRVRYTHKKNANAP